MSRIPRLATICALSLALGWAAGPVQVLADKQILLDRIVAVVGARSPGPGAKVVLLSDVDFRSRLALLAEGDPDGLTRSLPEALRDAMLQQMLGELMLATESERLSMAAPTEHELAAERMRLSDSVGGTVVLADAVRTLGVDPAELEALVVIRATVAAFLEANLERIVISDAEVEAAIQARKLAPN
ncbi:MAG: hypothetical protein RL385_4610, partial [Pseudomonadota bacterium]